MEQGDLDGAQAAYQQAIASGHPRHAPAAARNLGNILSERGDLAGARAAYDPKGALGLGALLARNGDIRGARAAYQRAIRSGDAAVRRDAARLLAKLPSARR